MSNDIKTFYNTWKTRYLKSFTIGSSSTRYYYLKQRDWNGGWQNDMYGGSNQKCYGTSEGIGYGMLITVMMAGYDGNAKTYFDGLLRTYNKFKSSMGSGLMSWVIPQNITSVESSATDGDMDAAYACLMAYKQWGYSSYKYKAIDIIKRIVNRNSVWPGYNVRRLSLGDWVYYMDSSDENYFYKSKAGSRSSDWMIGHLNAFSKYTNATYDQGLYSFKAEIKRMVNKISTSYSPTTGLMPDFVEGKGWYKRGSKWFYTVHPVTIRNVDGEQKYLEDPNDNKFNYNGCRYVMRMAAAYAHGYSSTSERNWIKAKLQKIASWVKSKHSNPKDIHPGYTLYGSPLDTSYDSDAFKSCLLSAFIATSGKTNSSYLAKGWADLKTIGGDSKNYYDDTINLLNLLLISGNWWRPY